jgi:hypothetical protein
MTRKATHKEEGEDSPTTDLVNWKHHTPSFVEKPQALIDLMQLIIQTHKRTWTDCQQLLTLFNTEE